MTPKRRQTDRFLHPARFSPTILLAIEQLLDAHDFGGLILDPFAGTGGVHRLANAARATIGIEIEPEWAATHQRTIVGNALDLEFCDESIDAIVTSPCYGNRLADHHQARDGSTRRSYTHDLQRLTCDPRRELHVDNAGRMQWGVEYQLFHERAWTEACRVLRPSGLFLLNVSDHIRKGRVVPVTDWHKRTLEDRGLVVVESVEVPTRRMRFGANGDSRVECELVVLFMKPGL